MRSKTLQLIHLILSFDNNFNRLPFHYFVFKQRPKNIFLKNEKIKIRTNLVSAISPNKRRTIFKQTFTPINTVLL